MYKDKDKQREAQRNWVRQKRAEQSPKEFKIRAEGTFAGSTKRGSTKQGSTKRGLDIKVFEDLPPDVQETIIRMTTDRNGKMDIIARAKRTAIAIKYQHETGGLHSGLGRAVSTENARLLVQE